MKKFLREFTLKAHYQENKLYPEDRCQLLRIAAGCMDSMDATKRIYEMAGRAL